jgi:Na+-driven multidrug efflux pump
MSEPAVSPPRAPAVFTQGSLARHVLVMTSTGSIGLVAVFMVDLLSLIYVSWLGVPALTAGVGFAAQVLFFIISLNIGLSIAVSAVVARAIGANDRPRAQQLASSGLTHTFIIATVTGLALYMFRRPALELRGARGAALDAADIYLVWTLPTNGLMALGMALSGVLRAVGDARRSMYVTLFGSIVTAFVDPLLILGLKMGVEGAALAAVVSRIVWIAGGLWGAVHVHGIVGRPDRKSVIRDLPPMMKIALPAILTNLAAPVANGYAVHAMANFGEAAVAMRHFPMAFQQIDRKGEVKPGQWVLVMGASGGLGSYAVQLCAVAGANAIGVISDDSKTDFVLQMGAKGVKMRRDFTSQYTIDKK